MRTLGGLKAFVNKLEELGELKRVTTPVDPRHEVAALLGHFGKKDGPAILFEQVKGYGMPIVGNLLGTRKRLALALGVEEKDLYQGLMPRLDQHIPPCLLTGQNDQMTFTPGKEQPLAELIPVLTHYAADSGPFITTGLTSARDPVNGVIGRGVHRLEIRGEAEIGISLVNPPLSEIYAVHKKQGTPMEVAITVGVDPAIFIGTVLKVSKGIDKFASIGGLMGSAVPMEKAPTLDLDIPAQADIVLEGYIDPTQAEKDGILGEVSGYYLSFSSPSVHITSVRLQKDAIYHALLPYGAEVDQLLVFVYGLNVVPKMKKEFPALTDIHFVPGTFGSHAVMMMATDDKGEVRRAITMALTFPYIKRVVAVDEDVNIRDPLDVEWAMATRFQAHRDLIVVDGLKGQPIDPSSDTSSGKGFISAKMGIDATRPEPEGFKKVTFPDAVLSRLPSILDELKKGN